jgi:putative transposase
VVSYESIREWGLRFGQMFATALRQRRPRSGDKWHLDEVFIRIRGKLHYLCRAVDQEGNVLDILVQSRRNTKAAKRFFRKLLTGLRYGELRRGETRNHARCRISAKPIPQ